MIIRLTAIAVLCGALGLAGCSSVGPTIGDALPEWAGGLPKDAPPRPGTPEYEEYRRRLTVPKVRAPAGAAADSQPQRSAVESGPGTPQRR